MSVHKWKSLSFGNWTSYLCCESSGFVLLLKRGILLPSSLSITTGKFLPWRGFDFWGFQEMVVIQVGSTVRPMPSLLHLPASYSWSGDDKSLQSRSKALLAVCFPFPLHLSMMCWHPNAQLRAQLASFCFPGGPHSYTCSAEVAVINYKSRAMQKNCGNAKNFSPRCLVLCSDHWHFLSKEALQVQEQYVTNK